MTKVTNLSNLSSDLDVLQQCIVDLHQNIKMLEERLEAVRAPINESLKPKADSTRVNVSATRGRVQDAFEEVSYANERLQLLLASIDL